MQDCIFCKIIDGQIPCHKIYEDEDVLSFLDIGPVNGGHSLVIPKKHFRYIDECDLDIRSKMINTATNVAIAVEKAFNCHGYNILCNNGRVAGQLVDHVHFHIIPRFEDDGVLSGWPATKYGAGEAEKILTKIKENL